MLRTTWRTWLVVAGILVVTLTAVILAVAVAPARFAEPLEIGAGQQLTEAERLEAEDRRLQSQNAVRTALLQAVGGVVLALGLAATWVTVLINRQGQITERFTRAVDQLGNQTSVDVRLGGIYALQRIARESEADRPAIVNVLAALIRGYGRSEETNSGSEGDAWWGFPLTSTPGTSTPDTSVPVLRRAPDIHAAAVVLGELHRVGERLDLPSAYLTEADLRGAHLGGARLQDAHLQNAHLQGAHLRYAHLQNADLRYAHLQNADLRGARLFRADLRGAHLQDARLQNALLRGARLWGADLRGARLFRADLRGARLQDADLRGARLQDADLQNARLEGADLRGASLFRANLQNARLEGADLEGANLQNADLQNARLEGANLQNADLQNARLEGANLEGVRADSLPSWPDDLDSRKHGVVEQSEGSEEPGGENSA